MNHENTSEDKSTLIAEFTSSLGYQKLDDETRKHIIEKINSNDPLYSSELARIINGEKEMVTKLKESLNQDYHEVVSKLDHKVEESDRKEEITNLNELLSNI